jgi:hypothetical protein
MDGIAFDVRMSRFSDALMEHFQFTTNRGAVECPDLVGKGSLDDYPPFGKNGVRTLSGTDSWAARNYATGVIRRMTTAPLFYPVSMSALASKQF